MNQGEARIARNYTSGGLLDRIKTALKDTGTNLDDAKQDDLRGGDEFHVGGPEATEALLAQLSLTPDMHVVDIGSGLGGPARHVALRHGCRVTGIDVTPEFVETATALTQIVGLDDRVTFQLGSGTKLPFENSSVDAALLLHVGMNIDDKPALFGEVARVLAPGGTFAVYDVMTGTQPGEISYPMPWAVSPEDSFVRPPEDYRAAAADAGLEVVAERDRSEFGIKAMQEQFARIAAEGPPPLGPHLFMGETGPLRMRNAMQNLADLRIRPVEIIFRKTTAA